MNAYSMDYRQSVAAARQDGMPMAEITETFGCSASWVRRLLQRQRETGNLEPRPRRSPDQRKLDDRQRDRLSEFVQQRPDATLAELITALDLKVHASTVCRALKVMGLPLKKSPCTPASKTAPTSRRPVPCGWSSFVTCS